MMMLFTLLNLAWFMWSKWYGSALGVMYPGYQPEQIHLAFGEKHNDIVVMWTTAGPNLTSSEVLYGVGKLDQTAKGDSGWFQDGGHLKRKWCTHKVVLQDLLFNTTYTYTVGSSKGWSPHLTFTTPPEGEDWVVSAAIYGDMGLKNAHSLPYLEDDVNQNLYHFIIHVGDFAYDLHDHNARVGDDFMNQIQPIASRVPYMTCPGNHEAAYNFSNYIARFGAGMPNSQDNGHLYFSWNIGPIHFVSISTEFYYDKASINPYWFESLKQQFRWIKADLAEANKPENREKRPWIIMYGHRPMYCSSDDDECTWSDVPQRQGKGLPEPGYGLEPLLKEFGVDLIIFGHEHSYERMLPLYDRTIYNGTDGNPYLNPQAPVHLITGSAGCKEDTYPIKHKKPWTVVASADYGYTKFKAHNKTHLHFEQVSVNNETRQNGGQVIDSFWLVREKHEVYNV